MIPVASAALYDGLMHELIGSCKYIMEVDNYGRLSRDHSAQVNKAGNE